MSSGSRGNAWRGGRRGYNFRGSRARGGGRSNLRGGRYIWKIKNYCWKCAGFNKLL